MLIAGNVGSQILVRFFVGLGEEAEVLDGRPGHYDQRSDYAQEEQSLHDRNDNSDGRIHSTMVRNQS